MSAPTLGERLAVAYGWEPLRRNHWPKMAKDNTAKVWCKNGQEISMHPPDPENSWPDFGAMLGWAEEQGIEWTYDGAIVRVSQIVGSNYCRVNVLTVDDLRRALTECILDAWEVKGGADATD